MEMPDAPLILHYLTGGKPWKAPLGHGSRGLWLKAFQRLCGKSLPAELISISLHSRWNEFMEWLQTFSTHGLQGRFLSKIAPKNFGGYQWIARRAEVETSAAGIQRIQASLERLDSALKREF